MWRDYIWKLCASKFVTDLKGANAMKIRLCGSYVISRSSDERCINFELGLFLAQLPSHCFVQTQLPYESLDTVVLIYTYDDRFDFEFWMNNNFEG